MNLTISTNPKAKQLTLTFTDMDWERLEQGNFYQGEQQVRSLLNTIGRELTRQLLGRKVSRLPSQPQATSTGRGPGAGDGDQLLPRPRRQNAVRKARP